MLKFSLLALLVAIATIAITFTEGVNLIGETLAVYKKILDQKRPGRNEIVDVDAMKMLIGIADEDASLNKCDIVCEKFLESVVGHEGVSWSRLETIITSIYGDQISLDPYQPQEVHIALTNDNKKMKVMWVTMSGLEKPFVEFVSDRESDWSKSRQSNAVSYTYSVPQKWWPVFNGVIYETDMNNLIPGMKYRYRVGGYDTANSTMRYSKEFTFHAAPDSSANRKTTVATLADHGTFMLLGFATVNKMVKRIAEGKMDLDMVFVAGDLSYAGLSSAVPALNIDKEDEFEHVWDLLGIQNEPIAASYPWMVGDGNHERFYNWTAFTNRYKMPQNPTLGSVGNFWYDFDYGNIHWISISSEHDLSEGSPQKAFLVASLEAATKNRANIPWIVVTLHKPLYCSAKSTPGGYADLLEDVFNAYDVDLVVTGHLHAYERVHPVFQNKVTCMPDSKRGRPDIYYSTGKGPVHVLQGNTGGMQWEGWVQPQPDWSAIRFANGFVGYNRSSVGVDGTVGIGGHDIRNNLPFNYTDTYGFGVITAWNATHLQYEAVADTEARVGTDHFWVVKRV